MKEIGASPFVDAVCPEPGQNTSDWGDMGDPVPGAPKAAEGQIKTVQFANLGNYTPTKIPGGGSY